MRLIKQGDEYGCGLACVAMLSGASYATVRRTYREITRTANHEKVKPTSLLKLKKIMDEHGIAIDGRMRSFRGRKPDDLNLACDALLKVNTRLEGEEWHWVVWDHARQIVLDPKVPSYKRLRFEGYWRLRRVEAEADL